MPLLRIHTNQPLDEQQRHHVMKQASRLIAQALNKPEQYMMVSVEAGGALMFAASSDPAAFVELKAIGLPAGRTGELSRLICGLTASELGVSGERTYINFTDVPASQWGWNAETF